MQSRTRRPGLDGPVRECCGRPTRWGVQAGVARTCEVPANDPPTYFAAGPWECQVTQEHRGAWVHTTTEPDEYETLERTIRLGR